MEHRDVIVIGGGHAGTEAASAAARLGASTVLVTLRYETIGAMSCNPAIGGLGKGHLVREIDALDGIMGKAADKAGIQFRLLNRRKGPAVQGPRTQADRSLYGAAVRSALTQQPGLQILEGEVVDLVSDAGRVRGVVLADGTELRAQAVVLTAGTFLDGVMHIGEERRTGGRAGDRASLPLASKLRDLALPRGRLKTGTPPRLDGTTIDWNALEMQAGDDDPTLFSFLHKAPFVRQISCGITHTNDRTHEIVRSNLLRSAMYGGHIEGVGPRYCPSIEDKVVRFAEKTSHQVFLEPEGLSDSTIYPNGISTSLPADVQEAYVRSIRGLERVRITQPGYAIEYDYFDPRSLSAALECRALKGLFLAGQINGTTGYEEAAAQGLVAGLNAALAAKGREPVVFRRTDSYIGVMIDDLTTFGVSEPYRMFTSRAEFRLTLRADNADQRLTPIGLSVGCIGEERARAFAEKSEKLEAGRSALGAYRIGNAEAQALGLPGRQDGARRTGLALLAQADAPLALLRAAPGFPQIDAEILQQIAREALYAQYEQRQQNDIDALKRDEATVLGPELNYLAMSGLSHELAGKLHRQRPETLAHASRIEGMTPAALLLILAHAKKLSPRQAAASAK